MCADKYAKELIKFIRIIDTIINLSIYMNAKKKRKKKRNVKRSCTRANKFSNLMLDIYTYIIWLLIRKTYFHIISTRNKIINEV